MSAPSVSPFDQPDGRIDPDWSDIHTVKPDAMKRPLRPLLIVEAANPEWTSVPLVGWNLSQAIMRKTNGLVVTQVRNKEAFLRAGLEPERDFVVIDNERTARALHIIGQYLRGGQNKGWTIVTALSSLSYYSFEKELWRRLGSRLIAGEFDVVHRITPLSPTTPSPIAAKLAHHQIPFVVGPLNGGLPWPEGFLNIRRQEREWLSVVRAVHKWLPSARATKRFASAVIAGSRHTLGEVTQDCRGQTFLMPENGIDQHRFPYQKRCLTADVLKVVFVGRLVPYKGADILIEAISRYRGALAIDLVIVGDGPQRVELESMVDAKGMRGQVMFTGWVDQDEMAVILSDRHVLGFPSIREFGGGVVVEAMAMGLVPIIANYGGATEFVDALCGISIDFHDRDSLIEGFTRAFTRLERDRAIIAVLSVNAGHRARKSFTWDAKAEQMLEIYKSTITKSYKTGTS